MGGAEEEAPSGTTGTASAAAAEDRR